MPAVTRTAAIATILAATVFLGGSTSAQSTQERDLHAAIKRAGDRQEPIVTRADKAMIAAKCGYAPDWDGDNISLNNGVLTCADGKKVSDDETRAMAKGISRRADKYVQGVMNDPAVKRAIDGTAQRAAKEAIEKAEKALARAGLAED